MARTPKRWPFGGSTSNSNQFPWVLALVVFIVLMAVGYNLGNDRSLSEREGVVTQTEAENDVIPSLPPQ